MEDMNKTVVRAWMEQGYALPMIIQSMEMQLQAAADQVYGLASPSGLLGTRVQASSASNAAFTRALERKEQTEREVDARLACCMLLRDQLVRVINRYTEGRECFILLRGRENLAADRE